MKLHKILLCERHLRPVAHFLRGQGQCPHSPGSLILGFFFYFDPLWLILYSLQVTIEETRITWDL